MFSKCNIDPTKTHDDINIEYNLISSHTLLSMWLFIHAGIKSKGAPNAIASLSHDHPKRLAGTLYHLGNTGSRQQL